MNRKSLDEISNDSLVSNDSVTMAVNQSPLVNVNSENFLNEFYSVKHNKIKNFVGFALVAVKMYPKCVKSHSKCGKNVG